MKEYNFISTPIVDIVNQIIIDAVNLNASDIHFDPAENYLKIRIRVDGDLRDYTIVENKYKRNLITRVKLLAGMNITESRLPQDGAIKSNIEGKDLDLRVSSLPTGFGEKVVIRILDYSMSLKGIESLGFTEENYKIILKMLANPNGIILITGATGSGKSTTVYSMLQRLNKEETNIITVEDPVEMNIEGVNQVQVNSEIGLDFANVLRSILRQDPNIILIGEIRDSETAKIAIRASITGHLVLSTLHTNNSITTVERLLDMDVERYLLSSSLKGIISQTLAKRLCKNCAKKRPTTDAEKRVFKKALNMDVNEIYEPGKCEKCRNGYKGRIALQEVLLINDSIRDAINENRDRSELRDLIYKKGVKTLFQDGLLKVIDGTTTMEEVFRLIDVADDIDVNNIYGEITEDDQNINENENNVNVNESNINPAPINEPVNNINDFNINSAPVNEPINNINDFNINPAPVNEPINNVNDFNINPTPVSEPVNNINDFNINPTPVNEPVNNINDFNINPTPISEPVNNINDFNINPAPVNEPINNVNDFNINPTPVNEPINNVNDFSINPTPVNEPVNNINDSNINPTPVNEINNSKQKETDLENTQDIFNLRRSITSDVPDNANSSYTDDLINLINQGFFE